MGVSGGYQAARHGPSMSPGCSKEAWDVIGPYLRKWAAKTHVARSEAAAGAAKQGGESGEHEHRGSEHNEKIRREGKHKHDTLEPCVEYMGPGGAGHYVKMVHNGIGESSFFGRLNGGHLEVGWYEDRSELSERDGQRAKPVPAPGPPSTGHREVDDRTATQPN